MKVLHTADLQIGARFTRFGDKADIPRAARITALRRLLELASEQDAEAILIAGDLFESNQIDNAVVEEAFAVLAAFPQTPVVILPGNHDPCDGPGCIWRRKPFSDPPPHVTVCVAREPVRIGDAVVLPVPITQKVSTKDPSLPLVDMAASVGTSAIRIGITHGALAIEGKHQPNDQPIALDAASRAGLDYLAVGHWHKPRVCDDGRLVMSGTPEPDDFDQASGTVTLVEIAAPGRPPRLHSLESATYRWPLVTVDLLHRAPTPAVIADALSGLVGSPASTILRLELTGPVAAGQRETLAASVAEATRGMAVVQVEDHTSTVLSEALWAACLREHPLLAQVVADIERARLFMTGRPPTVADEGLDVLRLDEFQALCADLNLATEELGEGVFEVMMAMLAAEVGATEPGGNCS